MHFSLCVFAHTRYELRAGRSPFESFSELDLYRKIRACQYKFPSDFSIPEKLLIGGLLQVCLLQRFNV
jgi:protein kinase A